MKAKEKKQTRVYIVYECRNQSAWLDSKKNECDNCPHHDGCYLSFLYDETSERIANQNERFPAKKAKKEDGNGI